MRCFPQALAAAVLLLSSVPVHAAPAATAQVASVKPKRGDWGVDLAAMDRRVRPGDDFFRFVNGRWYDNYQFKPDEIYVGARQDLTNLRRGRVMSLIEKAARDPAQRDGVQAAVGALYASFMDAERVDRLGVAALAPDLARIRAIATRHDLLAAFARAPLDNGESPFMGSTFYDFHAPGWVRYTITPGGLGLERPEAYLDASPPGQALRDAYVAYAAGMLRAIGESEPDTKAREILALETRLAKSQWPTSEARDFLKTANNQTPAELAAEAPGFDWADFLRETGADGLGVLIVRQPSAMKALVDVVNETPLPVWRSYLAFHLVSNNAEFLSSDLAAARFAFYGRRLSGQAEQAPRWSRGVDLVEGYLGQAVGRLYVAAYFPESSRTQVAAIFDDIRAVMRERIVRAAWMSDSTRAEALRKIDTLTIKIGYPQKWPSYDDLKFDATDLYGNLRQARRHMWRERLGMTRKPLDPETWQTTPQTGGAAANPGLNEITVPAGALEAPFFDPAADPAVNYGAIGGVLGHELSHMFDQLGRRMDATGALRDWWAPADASRYEAIAKEVEDQYDVYEAAPGHRVNGKFTLNENIADISGLGIAFEAYHRRFAGRTAPVLDGFTGDQRFFLGWAQMRAGKMREALLVESLAGDPHAPEYFRVNGVLPNLDGWYEAFDIRPGDPLYRAPAERARFW